MQSNLISRDMLQKRIRREPEIIVSGLRYIRADAVSAKISMAPSVGAVVVTRCKDCWRRGIIPLCPMCYVENDCGEERQVDLTRDDGFCHQGLIPNEEATEHG